MEDRLYQTLAQIDRPRASVVAERDLVDELVRSGWVEEADDRLYLTEDGATALASERKRRRDP